MTIKIVFYLPSFSSPEKARQFLQRNIKPKAWQNITGLNIELASPSSVNTDVYMRSIKSLNLTEGVKRALMESQQHNYLGVYVRTPECDLSTVGDLSQMTASQLLQYKGIGGGKLALICKALTEYDLTLAG